MSLDLTKYKLLSFDIYATLIDWETGLFSALQPLIDRLPTDSQFRNRKPILGAFSDHEHAIQKEHPTMLYNDVLQESYRGMAAQLGVESSKGEIDEEATAFGQSLGSYPPFPDTIAAMRTLGKHYKLLALSNVDRASFSRTVAGPLGGDGSNGVHFDAIYTAQDIGSYKPDLRNFDYLITHVKSDFGIEKGQILHVAQSLTHDHVPAKSIGLDPGVWISRGGGQGEASAIGGSVEVLEKEGKIKLGAVFVTLGDFATAVEKAFGDKN